MEKLINNFSNIEFDIFNYVKREVNKKEQSAMIFLSSGTTGKPKGQYINIKSRLLLSNDYFSIGVELTQHNLIVCMQSQRERIKTMKEYDVAMKHLGIAPWSHVLGFMSAVFTICLNESMMIFMPKFEGELYLRLIEKHKIAILVVAPPVVVFLAKTSLFYKYDLSSLRVIFCGAAHLTKEVEDEVKKRFKTKLDVIQG